MNIKLKNRLTRISRLPIVLLVLALGAGVASVGQAQDIPNMVITAERPSHCESAPALRKQEVSDEIRTTADDAVWETRIRVARDLGAKLNRLQPTFRVAGKYLDKRG
jgi:hypothetical protein